MARDVRGALLLSFGDTPRLAVASIDAIIPFGMAIALGNATH